ncbi:MAG: hypothetical protein HOI09_10660, partial [Porticoccaceae bacterium]|nr:hypothetical protein [Porticoccaceae bacterium]
AGGGGGGAASGAAAGVSGVVGGAGGGGGGVADGAFIDQNFNTTDVCMVLDIEKMSSRQKLIYFRKLK